MSDAIKILLGVPSSGQLSEKSAEASWLAALKHPIDRVASCCSGPNFNRLWVRALNAGEKGLYTHFAMMHTDIEVLEQEEGYRWCDILVEELEKSQADFVSVPSAIKDHRGLTSSGIGNPTNRWNPWKRFTTRELEDYPLTFDARAIGYGDKFLLHNHALCMWDLRKPLWYYKNLADNASRTVFNFEERLVKGDDGLWCCEQESEDWAFSRNLWEIGARTVITRRVHMIHMGALGFENWGTHGLWATDLATAPQWRAETPP